jgi:hypothetical protein
MESVSLAESPAKTVGLGGCQMPEPATRTQQVSLLVVVALLAILIVAMLVTQPLILRAVAQLPGLGDWAKRAALRDAGLSWLYEDGQLLEQPVLLERDGYRLSVLGYLADSLQTSLVYALEGPGSIESLDSFVNRVGVTFTGPDGLVSRWRSYPLATPIGVIFVQQGGPLVGETAVTVSLCGQTGAPFPSATITVSPGVKNVSSQQVLDQSQTQKGVSLSLHRLLRTPAIMVVELDSAQPVFIRPENVVLKSAGGSVAGVMQNSSYSQPQGDGSYRTSIAFDYVGRSELAQLTFNQLLITAPIDGPLLDPLGGQANGRIELGDFSAEVEASVDEAGVLNLHAHAAGYDQQFSPIIDWAAYQADGGLIEDEKVDRLYTVSEDMEPGEETQRLISRQEGLTVSSAKANAVRVPYGPFVFDLR